jgi:hypothetical protein
MRSYFSVWCMLTSMGMETDLNAGLGYLPITYAIALFGVLMLERVLHSVVWMCISLARFPTLYGPSSMVGMSQDVLAGSLNMCVELMRVWVGSIGGLLQWAFYYIPMLAIFFFAVWVMTLVSSSQAGLVRDVLLAWNNGTSEFVRGTILVPLQLLNLLFEVLVPFWNAMAYFWKRIIFDVVVPTLRLNTDPVIKALTSGGAVVQSLTDSTVSFMTSMATCDNSACLSPGSRVFDVLSPMVHMRLFTSYVLLFSRETCSVLRPVLDLLAYPLLDSNLGQALHAGVNSILYAVVQMPLVTIARCAQAANDTDSRLRSIACTPDVAPVFNFAAASVRYAGILSDNWLDVAWITILSVFGKAPDACEPSPVSFVYDPAHSVFGYNETRLIGLGATSYAVTDGNSVQYTFFRGKPEYVSPNLEPPLSRTVATH